MRLPGVLAVFLLMAGCASLPPPPKETIIRRDQGEISREQLLAHMDGSRVILLGEKHDNPHHHRLQQEILSTLLAAGKRPALGFEAFSRDQTGLLMNFAMAQSSPFKPVAEDRQETFLRRQLGWVHRQDWDDYAPLLRMARQYRLPVFGADLPVGLRVRLTRAGRQEMSRFERLDLTDTGFQQDAYRALMFAKLSASHCGTADEALLGRLYDTWLARNDAMARAVVDMAEDMGQQPVVMILGAGHIEHDMAVPERISHLKPQWRVVSVGMAEMTGADAPALSEPVTTQGHRFPHGYAITWWTPAPQREEEDSMCTAMATAGHGTKP